MTAHFPGLILLTHKYMTAHCPRLILLTHKYMTRSMSWLDTPNTQIHDAQCPGLILLTHKYMTLNVLAWYRDNNKSGQFWVEVKLSYWQIVLLNNKYLYLLHRLLLSHFKRISLLEYACILPLILRQKKKRHSFKWQSLISFLNEIHIFLDWWMFIL